jgi:hypothetical protein
MWWVLNFDDGILLSPQVDKYCTNGRIVSVLVEEEVVVLREPEKRNHRCEFLWGVCGVCVALWILSLLYQTLQRQPTTRGRKLKRIVL